MAGPWEEYKGGPWDEYAGAPTPQEPSTVRERGSKLPPAWDVEIDAGPEKAVFDKDAGAYLVVRDNKPMKVMRDKRTKGLFLEPYQGPSALGTNAQNFAAGAGKAVTDLGMFGKQVATLAGNTLGLASDEDVDRVMKEAAEKSRIDAELMGTKAGFAGNIAGNVATIVAGGGLLKGAGQAAQSVSGAGKVAQGVRTAGQAAETAGKALTMPKSVKEAAIAGGAIGGAQPFQDGLDVLGNVAVGAAAGAAGQKIAEGIGKAIGFAVKKIKAGGQMDKAIAEAAQEAGLDPAALSDVQKQRFAAKIAEYAKQAQIDEAANPEAAARIARAEKLDIPIAQAQAEKNMAGQIEMNRGLPYSEDLQGLRMQQRQALDARIEDLIGATKSKSGGQEVMAGEAQKEGMRAFEKVTKKAVKDAYDKAATEAGELPVSASGVLGVLNENRGVDGVKPVLMKLKELGALDVDEGGNLIAKDMTAADLYKVRKLASSLQKSPTTAHIGGEVKTAVDAMYDAANIPQYTEAAALRRAQSMQFDERGIPAKLVGKKGQEDLIGDDKLMKWIVGRDTKELERYKQALVSGNEALLKPVYKDSPEARKIGVQSARDLKAGFLGYLKNNAVVKDEVTGTQTVSPESLVNAYKAMGGGRMDVADAKAKAILGPKMAERLKTIVQTAEDISTVPGAVAKGSGRFNQAISRGFTALLGMARVPVDVQKEAGKEVSKSAAKKLAQPAQIMTKPKPTPAAYRAAGQSAAVGALSSQRTKE